jgi:phage baseplate assembly protein W
MSGFLGTGWKFPVSVDNSTGRIMTSSADENIYESIKIILSVFKGERVMQPEYGCNIRDYIFHDISYTDMSSMETDICNTLIINEPRIKDVNVSVTKNEEIDGQILISISYCVRSTNNAYNKVFPFMLYES